MNNRTIAIEDFEGDYDPFHAMLTIGQEDKVVDVYGEIHRRMQLGSVHEVDLRAMFDIPGDQTLSLVRGVTLFGHARVREVLFNPEIYSNKINDTFLGAAFGRSITTMDPPEHRGYRQIFQRAFLPGMIQKFKQERVPKVINQLVDQFVELGRANLVEVFTRYFAFNFINEFLELPVDDRITFQRLAVGQLAVSYDPPRGKEATEKLTAYLCELIAQRRHHPVSDNDFVHAIATAQVAGQRLPDDVVVAFFRQLMNAGGDTSYHGLGNILAALLTHPQQLAEVRADRSLVLKAIDEGLRWECPVMAVFRNPLKPVTIEGVDIGPEDYINVVLGSANRDPAVYENPDQFHIHRQSLHHTAFGAGAHICIGQHLARMEMDVAINILLDRLPNLRLDPDLPAPTIHGLILRGPDALNVMFD